jgi:translation initiation factor 2B subunit (eIF-2B alpha/beta/delta family)
MFEEIARDRVSGASALTRRAARELAEAVEASQAADPGAFWNELLASCRELLGVGRQMASIVNLANRVLAVAEKIVLSGLPPEAAQQAVSIECEKVWEFGETLLDDLGQEARGAGADFHVILGDSRPAREGVAFARELRSLGVPSTLVLDAALPAAAASADIVLVGADSVSERDFENKIGSYGLAVAARASDVPYHVVTLTDRFLPEALRAPSGPAAPPSEIFENAPPGIEVEGHLLEPVPLTFVRSIVTECESTAPDDVPARLREAPVSPALLQLLFPSPRAGAPEDH